MRKNSSAKNRKPEILEQYYRVIMAEGLEGASISKIADRMGIHPSLIIHYFKSKENMTVELVELVIEKFEAPHFLKFRNTDDPKVRFRELIETLFSKEWSYTVDPSVFYAFYYLSFRHPVIRRRFEAMFKRFRDFLSSEIGYFKARGILHAVDPKMASDMIMTLVEGLVFHAHFLAEDEPFKEFAAYARETTMSILQVDSSARMPA
jgi:AcrR family transcriptional regulator